ncbi:DNA-processing protein DprA [Maribacter cobaltidurans]|uniref:DNA-protecting protein DprA n=1 Tax=Maribacter cobaltidurans TaxID=1178778 RepID=A0A223V400_9FLAO|nr:DNA-processing protein DprA [Maribacter cobaltidurans]ASV30143.1 DNA-protecting protein DprA [Maribacter cobaltidurans]GGD76130.1 DNA processing protein DprA [Maribacter cobaltidurans]
MSHFQHTAHELIAILRLQHVPNVGDVVAKKLIGHCGSALAVFEERKSQLTKIDGIGAHTIRHLQDPENLRAAEKEYEYILKHNIDYCYFDDANYPKHLKHCIDGPILLFKKGNMDLEGRRIISVVGTRNITSYGTAFCERFVADLAPLNPIIVSGFAYGVDICIQREAINQGLQTIGCLAHGLNQIYPKVHAKYESDVLENGGFFTEFWSSSNPERENFLRRNRVIAGMSEATVVIESAEKGGSLVTADIAHSYNRDVFALPGRSTDKYSMGCNNLIKQQKAHILTSAADLVYLLNWELEEKKSEAVQKQLFVDLDETEQKIYSYLQQQGKQLLDSIALDCQMPIFKASATLLNMEMKGVIRPLPGKMFEAI